MKPPHFSKLPARFWDKVEVQESGCWNWTGDARTIGYGRFHLDGQQFSTHRLSAADYFGDDWGKFNV